MGTGRHSGLLAFLLVFSLCLPLLKTHRKVEGPDFCALKDDQTRSSLYRIRLIQKRHAPLASPGNPAGPRVTWNVSTDAE